MCVSPAIVIPVPICHAERERGISCHHPARLTTAFLAAGASKTFSADSLDIPSPGTSVIAGLYRTERVNQHGQICEWEIGQDINKDQDLDDCVNYPAQTTLYVPLFLAGVAKSAVGGASLPYTTTNDAAVSGYNGLSGMEVGAFNAHYLPVVQTNCGPGDEA